MTTDELDPFVRKSDFISRRVENDLSEVAKKTGNVKRILSSIFIAEKISGWQTLHALFQTTISE